MKTKQTNELPTPEQLKTFTDYRNSITGERLAILNHARLNFSESADMLKEAQEKYNKSLLFSYNDYKAAENQELLLLTSNQPKMDDFFIKPSNVASLDIEDFVMYEECREDLRSAIIFFNSKMFDFSLMDQGFASNHLTTMSMLSRMIDKIELHEPFEENILQNQED